MHAVTVCAILSNTIVVCSPTPPCASSTLLTCTSLSAAISNMSFQGSIKPEGDVFGLAGDIAEIQHLEPYDAFWDWCSEHFKETIFVPGNHDWYGCWISIMR